MDDSHRRYSAMDHGFNHSFWKEYVFRVVRSQRPRHSATTSLSLLDEKVLIPPSSPSSLNVSGLPSKKRFSWEEHQLTGLVHLDWPTQAQLRPGTSVNTTVPPSADIREPPSLEAPEETVSLDLCVTRNIRLYARVYRAAIGSPLIRALFSRSLIYPQ